MDETSRDNHSVQAFTTSFQIRTDHENAPKHGVCASCPWNRNAALGYWHPVHLLSICYALSGDKILGAMGCHKWDGSHPSLQRAEAPPCGGWLRVAAETPGVRLMVAFGITHVESTDRSGHNLYEDVREMLRWNGFDLKKLPPLTMLSPDGKRRDRAWSQRGLERFKNRLETHPDAAYTYVLDGSPMTYPVDPERKVSTMPEDARDKWVARVKREIARETKKKSDRAEAEAAKFNRQILNEMNRTSNTDASQQFDAGAV